MTKVVLYIVGIIAVAVVALAYVSAPEKPRVWPKAEDRQKVQFCLKDIPRFYKSYFFTRPGHMVMWVGAWVEKTGLAVTSKWGNDFTHYTALKFAVRCYIDAAGNNHLHMAQSPTEFTFNFNSLAKAYNISARLK
ncbi:hypothetical protein ACFL17_03305 [Pseudomonadota bacterium]